MNKDFLTLQNATQRMESFIRTIREYPGGYEGTGIVIPGGGLKYFTNAWVALRVLRKLGCQLPIQIWHLGPAEADDRMRAITAPYGVEFVDAFEVRRRHPVRRLNGWELKPFSILHCPFKHVLLLDADNVPVVNPEFLFGTPQFHETGAIFWPDFGHLKPSAPIWNLCGVPYRDEPEWESGQIVVDKERCWRSLQLAMWFNEYSDFFYEYVLGDKETYHLAFRKLGQTVAMPATPVRALKWTLCQHDFAGNRIFQHRVNDKWSLEKDPDFVWDFAHDTECRAFLDELQILWFGKKQRSPRWDATLRSQKANEVAREITGSVFHYERVGFDRRPMTFLPDGRIGQGNGVCDAYWDLKEEAQGKIVLLISSKSEVTCALRKNARREWEGAWLEHERMPVMLSPIRQAGAPVGNRIYATRSRKVQRFARLLAAPRGMFADCRRHVADAMRGAGFNVENPASGPIQLRVSSHDWRLLFQPPGFAAAKHSKTVWFTSFDSVRLPAEQIRALNSAATIIVPSEWNASSLSCLGVSRPVRVVPPGLNPAVFRHQPMKMNGPCVFGAAMASDSDETAAAVRLMNFFCAAFPHERDVALYLWWRGAAEPPVPPDPRIQISRGADTDDDFAAWLQNLTCLVSIEAPHGWPAIEHQACATGRPLLGTRFGGVTEFFSEESGYAVDFTVGLGNTQRGRVKLVEVNAPRLIERFREVHADRANARERGRNARELVSSFTWKRFGRRVTEILEALDGLAV